MFFFIALLMTLALVAVVSAGDEKSDAAALCDFYKTVPAAGKAKLTNWCKNQSPCNELLAWYGVSCTNKRVDVIAIEGLGGGILPPSWGNMDELIMISMYGDGLTGRIPSELGNLKKMGSLWLNENQLTGPIPASFCNYAKTSNIDFYANNGITCYPSCLSTREFFMSHGRGNVKTVCPADGGANLPQRPVDDCSNAPNKDTLSCNAGTRRECLGGKFVCHSGNSGTTSSSSGSSTSTGAKPVTANKCPDSKWKAVTGYTPLRCSAPKGVKSCPTGWKRLSAATSTKGVTCSKGSAPTHAPTLSPAADYAGDYGEEQTYAAE